MAARRGGGHGMEACAGWCKNQQTNSLTGGEGACMRVGGMVWRQVGAGGHGIGDS